MQGTDTSTLQQFLHTLFEDAEGLIEWRVFKTDRLFCAFTNMNVIDGFVARHVHDNVYFGVATRRDDRSGTTENCLHLPALFADFDFKTDQAADERLARLNAFPFPPSVLVGSGRGRNRHAYWLLKEPMDLQVDAALAKTLLRRLALTLGADLGSAEPAHVLRPPGSFNQKSSPALPVTLLALDETARYTLQDFDELLQPGVLNNGAGQSFHLPPVIEGGQRNTVLFSLGRSLKSKCLTSDSILNVLQMENRLRCQPPLDDGELQEIFRSVMRQADRAGYRGCDYASVGPPIETPNLDTTRVPKPPVLADEAFRGLIGIFVKQVESHTEADKAALLSQFKVAFGKRWPSGIWSGPRLMPAWNIHGTRCGSLNSMSAEPDVHGKGSPGMWWSMLAPCLIRSG